MIKNELFALEKTLWQNDFYTYAQTFSEDSIIAFSDIGYRRMSDALEAIKLERKENRYWEQVVFKNEKHTRINEDCHIITYMVKSKWNNNKKYFYAIASSVYFNDGNRWKVKLHQQTAIDNKMFEERI